MKCIINKEVWSLEDVGCPIFVVIGLVNIIQQIKYIKLHIVTDIKDVFLALDIGGTLVASL